MKETFHRWVAAGAGVGMRGLARRVSRASLVPDEPFLDPAAFAWTRTLEDNWRPIRAELDRVLVRHAELPNFRDVSKDQYRLPSDDHWKTFLLQAYGYRAPQNTRRCPETMRVLGEIPGLQAAFFSILSPGRAIPPHSGPFKGVLRAHLGLRVPEPAEQCGIRVGSETRHWQEGKVMVFDDTFDHETWNRSDGVRVVLFLDIERPLRGPMRAMNGAVLKAVGWSPLLRDAVEKHEAWERAFYGSGPAG